MAKSLNFRAIIGESILARDLTPPKKKKKLDRTPMDY